MMLVDFNHGSSGKAKDTTVDGSVSETLNEAPSMNNWEYRQLPDTTETFHLFHAPFMLQMRSRSLRKVPSLPISSSWARWHSRGNVIPDNISCRSWKTFFCKNGSEHNSRWSNHSSPDIPQKVLKQVRRCLITFFECNRNGITRKRGSTGTMQYSDPSAKETGKHCSKEVHRIRQTRSRAHLQEHSFQRTMTGRPRRN